MRKKRSLRQPLSQCCLIVALTCAILLGGLPSVPSFAAGTTYYVSETTGDDARTPQQAMDRATPWKTIQKAADTLSAGDTCIILAGTYRETVTPANSGTPGNPITFKADTGATVVISGLEEVTGQWTVHSGNIYKTTATLGLGDNNQLFVDGKAVMLARWPNSTGDDWALSPTYALCEANTNLSTIYNASIPNIDWTGAKIFHTPINNKGWASWETTVLSSAPGRVNFNAPLQPHWDKNGSRQGTQFYLSNKLEVLDSDNEWYFDASTNTLYLQMTGGADPNSAKVEYKSRVYGLDLKGKGFINVEGIDLFGTTLVTDGTSNNSIIDRMKAYHIWVTREVGNNHYAHVTNPYSGIALLGENLTVKNSEIAYSDGNGIIVAGKNNNIINNHIHDVNYKGCYAAGVYLMGERNLISHNTITRTGRSTITGNLGFKDCVIQYNDLSSPGHKTRDGGVMYFSWVNGGHSEIHHNILHDGRTEAGIYVDNNTHGLTIYNNLVYNASNSANGAYCFGGPNEYVSFINNTSHDKGILQGGWPPKNGSDYLGSYYINNISVDGLFKTGEITYLNNHVYNYVSPGFKDVANKDFTLTAGAATATASSEYSSAYTADLVNDGLTSTRWSALNGQNQWLELDFGASKTFNKIVTRECVDFGDRIQGYQYQYHDGSNWVTFVNGTTVGASHEDAFAPVTASRIRLNVTQASDAPTIWEIEVYNEVQPNLALTAAATASTTWSTAYTADKAKDNSLSTRWASNQNNNQWLEFSFTNPVDVNHVVLKECIDYGQRVQNYKVQHYSNNVWVDLATGTTIGTEKTHDFAVTTVSKIRVFISQASGPPTLWEMGLYRK